MSETTVTVEEVQPTPVEVEIGGLGPRGIPGPPVPGVPVFVQAAEPAGAGPYLWYKTDGAGNTLDIYTMGVA